MVSIIGLFNLFKHGANERFNGDFTILQVLKSIIEKFRGIVLEENFKKQYHDEMIRSEIMEIIHLLIGNDVTKLLVFSSLVQKVTIHLEFLGFGVQNF